MTALTIVYFAWVREAIGRDEEQVDRPAAGARIADLKRVLSHPIALAQCERTLKGLKLNVVEHFDTAGAARDVAEAGDPTQAAIAPVGAAEVYGLSILRNDLQDSSDNRTRFVLLGADRA